MTTRASTNSLFAALAQLEVLRDDQHRPYDPAELPCTWLPQMWDDDASPKDRQHAAWQCEHDCPALKACHNRREQLQTAAEGTWAGVTIRRRHEPDRTDPLVKEWAEVFGLQLPTPRRKGGR